MNPPQTTVLDRPPHPENRENVPCPECGSNNTTFVMNTDGTLTFTCGMCGHSWTDTAGASLQALTSSLTALPHLDLGVTHVDWDQALRGLLDGWNVRRRTHSVTTAGTTRYHDNRRRDHGVRLVALRD